MNERQPRTIKNQRNDDKKDQRNKGRSELPALTPLFIEMKLSVSTEYDGPLTP